MKVKDIIGNERNRKFFILDSHQDAMGKQELMHQHNDKDYVEYSYNVHNFNKLSEGDLFLYRRPGKLSPDKKFHIYGGGIISKISPPDSDGFVKATIKNAYRLDVPIS